MIEDRDAVPGDEAGAGAESAQVPEAPEQDAAPSPEAFAAGTVAGEALPAAAGVDYKDRWLRSEAELQNFRRRAARDREDSVTRAQDGVLLEAIGVLDDLERALATLGPEHADEPWAQGVVLTAQRMRDMLARFGVLETEAAGRAFDPSVHEAMVEVDAPEGVAPGAVAQVFLKGYRRGERTLRPARVVVARSGAKG